MSGNEPTKRRACHFYEKATLMRGDFKMLVMAMLMMMVKMLVMVEKMLVKMLVMVEKMLVMMMKMLVMVVMTKVTRTHAHSLLRMALMRGTLQRSMNCDAQLSKPGFGFSKCRLRMAKDYQLNEIWGCL